MAYYIASNIPIKGFQKAFVKLREELYSDLDIDFELNRQIEAYQRDNKTLASKEETKREKEFITGLVLAFLLRKTKFKYIGYYAMLDAIVKTHVDNYKPVFIQQKIYEKDKDNIKEDWGKEVGEITTLLKMDQQLNNEWHDDNREYIRDSSFQKLAKFVANAYILNSTVQQIQKSLKTTRLQNQSIIQSIGYIIPTENTRLYDIIRTNKVPTAKIPYVISNVDGRWNFHQWQTYSHTDYPCYSVDGQIKKVGEEFSNGFISPLVHRNCYCTLKPVFRK